MSTSREAGAQGAVRWGAGSIRVLADDLTGALDSAAAFGVGVPVALDRPPAPDPAPDLDPAAARAPAPAVAVVATATRDVPLEALPAALAGLAGWLAGAALAFKKVDSLLRGNTFAEVAWLARAGGFRRVVFAPAFPAQGRYTVAGRACLQRAGEACDAARAEPGPGLLERLQAADAALHPGAPPLVWLLPEVREQADLARVMATGLASGPAGAGCETLWCGSAGLAQALAEALNLPRATALDGPDGPAAPVPDVPAALGPDVPAALGPLAGAPPAAGTGPAVWVVGASHHPVTRRQWQQARARWPVRETAYRPGCQPPARLHLLQGEDAAFHGALAALAPPRAPGAPAQPSTAGALPPAVGIALLDLSLHRVVTAAEAASLLARQAAALVALPPPGALLVLGGDTLRALFLASGARSMVSGEPLQPGWGRARWRGGAWDGLVVDARSGAFGGDDDLCRALEQRLGAGPAGA